MPSRGRERSSTPSRGVDGGGCAIVPRWACSQGRIHTASEPQPATRLIGRARLFWGDYIQAADLMYRQQRDGVHARTHACMCESAVRSRAGRIRRLACFSSRSMTAVDSPRAAVAAHCTATTQRRRGVTLPGPRTFMHAGKRWVAVRGRQVVRMLDVRSFCALTRRLNLDEVDQASQSALLGGCPCANATTKYY